MNVETAVFEARGITKQYPGTLALDNVDFDVRPGEVHALVGENGAGKSTLMLIMAGILKPDHGNLMLDGNPISLQDPHHAQLLGISLVFQELALSLNMSVAENVFTHTQPVNRLGLIRFEEMYEATRQPLQALGVDVNPRTPLRHYNLAVHQIVAIARAIQRQARVLLLDEPTSAIGRRETERLFRIIHTLRDRGMSIVYVSHKLDEVFAIANRITVLKDGKRVGTVPVDEISPDAVVRMMVGRELDKSIPPRNGTRTKPMLELRNLSGPGYADVNLTAYAGQVLGLFGLTGAGRTDLARGIFGIVTPKSGTILLDGQSVSIDSPGRAMQLGLAYIPEDRKEEGLFLDMSLKDNVAAANLHRVSRGALIDNNQLDILAREAVRQLQISTRNIEQRVRFLSGGNQQKVLFAKWLARRSKVLIADEPTRGVDVGTKADIHALLRDLARQGAAVVVISSELPEIMGLSDQVAVMRAGRVVGVFDSDQATDQQIVAYAAGANVPLNSM
ncbi:MAG: sugar ABC transporter ATP-binding protein [Chloroflexi bacterium]|nr:sugar ABC transporter ATP-binding protein [Chloroflexota bacterium]